MSAQVFVDESKAKGYLLVATSVPSAEINRARRELRRLVMPGQRGLHMRDERDSRRHAIADTVAGMSSFGVQATIYDAGKRYPNEKARRARCFAGVVEDAVHHGKVVVTLDRDESLVAWDRQQLIELRRTAGIREALTYKHNSRGEELLLALPDTIAWCWARGGDWRRRVKTVVREVRPV